MDAKHKNINSVINNNIVRCSNQDYTVDSQNPMLVQFGTPVTKPDARLKNPEIVDSIITYPKFMKASTIQEDKRRTVEIDAKDQRYKRNSYFAIAEDFSECTNFFIHIIKCKPLERLINQICSKVEI